MGGHCVAVAAAPRDCDTAAAVGALGVRELLVAVERSDGRRRRRGVCGGTLRAHELGRCGASRALGRVHFGRQRYTCVLML